MRNVKLNSVDSVRSLWKTVRLRHLGLAFFWACSMLTFRSSFLLGNGADTPENATIVTIVSFAVNAATLFAFAALVEKNPGAFERISPWSFVGAIVAGIAALYLSGSFSDGVHLALMVGGSALAGLGYGYFWGSWAQVYALMHPARVALYIPLAFLLTTTVFLLVSLAHELAGISAFVLMLVLPVASLICLQRCRMLDVQRKPQAPQDNFPNTKNYVRALGSLWPLVLATLIFSCLFGFVWEITVFSLGSVNDAHLVPLFGNFLVAVVLVALVALTRKRIDLDLAYQILAPVFILLFAAMPFFWESEPLVINTIMSVSYGVFDVIIWYTVATTAFDFSVSGLVVGGIVRALSIVSRLLGIGVGYIFMIIPDRPSIVIVGISLGALYVLGMLYIFYRRRNRLPQTPLPDEVFFSAEAQSAPEKVLGVEPESLLKTASDEATLRGEAVVYGHARGAVLSAAGEKTEESLFGVDTLEATCAILAEDYQLTRREAEVLPYLAKGRSAKVIAQALFVSESTIRTHIRRIFEKTDLHSKQELIDFIEHYGA